ncbi:unnamed protein product [Brassicogethes aeneus]|uniref:Uncharacterized protein n=1 Tax=Brassicogethes aeneus TaxID=1431903 RepID=A0A9P0FFY1_BRAAE|nr:unnamed protein product [Brassicogethes aeneus]
MSTINDSVHELREDIPLKSGSRSTSWCFCSEDCLGGSRFINFAFGTLTVVITFALLIQIYYGDYQVIPHGSVATDNFNCSKIGTYILKEKGNAVDAAIASAVCLAVTNPHLTGLDAEGQILIYNHRTRIAPTFIDFSGINVVSEHLPRLVLGLAYLHQIYGSLEWKKLITPSVELAKNGFLVQKSLAQAIKTAKAEDIFGFLETGNALVLEKLGNTLKTIANIPENELYSYITLTNKPNLAQSIKTVFNNYDIYVPGSSSIGPSLIKNLEKIENLEHSGVSSAEYIYRVADITENSYNDLNITTNFHLGTSSNVAVMDLDENYVSLITGMYAMFGSGELTSAGYFLDDHNKGIPIRSRVPIILTDGEVICGKRMVFGANDLAVATQLITLAVQNQNATEIIEQARFHILPNGKLGIEGFTAAAFSDEVLMYLNTLSQPVTLFEPYSSSNIVEKIKDDLTSHSDSRGGGIASRF